MMANRFASPPEPWITEAIRPFVPEIIFFWDGISSSYAEKFTLEKVQPIKGKAPVADEKARSLRVLQEFKESLSLCR